MFARALEIWWSQRPQIIWKKSTPCQIDSAQNVLLCRGSLTCACFLWRNLRFPGSAIKGVHKFWTFWEPLCRDVQCLLSITARVCFILIKIFTRLKKIFCTLLAFLRYVICTDIVFFVLPGTTGVSSPNLRKYSEDIKYRGQLQLLSRNKCISKKKIITFPLPILRPQRCRIRISQFFWP